MHSYLGLVGLALVLSLTVCGVTAQTRPKLAEAFESSGSFSNFVNGTNYVGLVSYHISQPEGKALTTLEFISPASFTSYTLQRFDLVRHR
jgi:hypothetical protein